MCIYIYIYIYTHIFIYTYIHLTHMGAGARCPNSYVAVQRAILDIYIDIYYI